MWFSVVIRSSMEFEEPNVTLDEADAELLVTSKRRAAPTNGWIPWPSSANSPSGCGCFGVPAHQPSMSWACHTCASTVPLLVQLVYVCADNAVCYQVSRSLTGKPEHAGALQSHAAHALQSHCAVCPRLKGVKDCSSTPGHSETIIATTWVLPSTCCTLPVTRT